MATDCITKLRVNIAGADAQTVRKLALYYGRGVSADSVQAANWPLDGSAQTPRKMVKSLAGAPEVQWELWDLTTDIPPETRKILHPLAQALIMICAGPDEANGWVAEFRAVNTSAPIALVLLSGASGDSFSGFDTTTAVGVYYFDEFNGRGVDAIFEAVACAVLAPAAGKRCLIQ
jgi:hypothetical protein